MPWQEAPFVAPQLLGGAIGIFLLGYLFARADPSRDLSVAWLAALTAGVVVWTAASAAGLVVTTLGDKLLWFRVTWLGTGTVVLAWPAFVLAITGRERWARWPRVLVLAAVPAVAVVAAVTTPAHSLFVERPRVAVRGGLAVLVFDYGPILDLVIPALFGLNTVITGVLVRDLLAGESRRRELLVLLLAGLLPMLGGAYSQLVNVPIDYTPLMFAVTTPLLTWAVVRWHLFDFASVARERAIDGMEDGVVVVDGEDRLVYANATATEAMNLEGVDTLGGLRERCPPIADAVAEPGTVAELETTVEGGRAVFEVRASRVTGDRGDRRGWLLYLDDLTDRRAVERRYGTIIERSTSLVIITDGDGVVQYASPGHEQVLGYAPDEIVGESVFEFSHPDDRDRVREHFARTLADDHDEPVEHRIRTADGRWLTMESVSDDLRDDPVIEGIVARSHDVTARRRYEQRLSVLHRVLRHNLRNNVNVIQGHAADLADSADPAVAGAAEQILRKTEELVDLGRKATVAERIDVRPDPVAQDLAAVVDDCVAEATERHPAASFSVDAPETARVSADARASVAVENALDNAVEHNEGDAPRVDVTVEPVSRDGVDYYELRVTDDGPPIPEVDRETIAAGEESPLAHARGLGLWLIHWIVTQSGGDLALERTDAGNVVRMTFPRAES